MPEHDVPVDGMLEVSIDGDTITRVSVKSGETVEITMEPDT